MRREPAPRVGHPGGEPAPLVRVGSAAQPDDAIISQLGAGSFDYDNSPHCGGNLSVYLYPGGWSGSPVGERPQGNYGILVFDLSITDAQYHAGMSSKEIPPFTKDEVEAITEAAKKAGFTVLSQWNGAGAWTMSLGVNDVGDSVQEARRRYSMSNGFAVGSAVTCAFVTAPYPMPSGPAPSDDDLNLEAVRRALIEMQPLLEVLDVHAKTVAAGARGHIEGEDVLAFVKDKGHGVLFPAETALRLVRLAAKVSMLGLEE